MCKELDRDICTINKIVINAELCDGRSDKGKNHMKVNFQTVLFISECRSTLDGRDGRRRREYCKDQGPR